MAFPPTFILSLDCEGKWGMADGLRPLHHRLLTNANLTAAYGQLIAMLGRHRIPATFAFVMAFALSSEEKRRFEVLDEASNPSDPWLRPYWDSLAAGQSEGWHLPEAVDMVRRAGLHEIASHSFRHRPIGDSSIDPAGAARELALAAEVARLRGVDLKTLVFPRNEVGSLEALRAAGYLGFRSGLDRRGGRVAALLEEFSVWRGPQQAHAAVAGLVAIPSGHFFNWRFGLRRIVPPALTVARWRRQLEACARDGGVVHLWLHPHNLITAPRTAPVLDKVLAQVARLRDQGRIEVLTQRAYCERVLAMCG